MAKRKKKSAKNKTKSTTKTQSSDNSSKNTKPAPLFDGLDNGKRILIITMTIIAWFFISICLINIPDQMKINTGYLMAIVGAIYIISVGSTCSAYINGTYKGDIESLRNLVATTQVSSFGFIGACLYLLYDKYTKLEFTFDTLLGNDWKEIGISLLKWIALGVYISMMIIVLWI